MDGFGRVTQVMEDPGASPHLNYVTKYPYDAFGNMTPSGNPTPPTVSFNTNNQIVGQTYDQGGNHQGVNGNTLSYDVEARVASETDGVSKAVETYVYDGDGRRAEKYGANGADHLGTARLVTMER